MNLPAISQIPGEFGIYRLAPDTALTDDLHTAALCFIARTDEELSVVCLTALAEQAGLTTMTSAQTRSAPWSCLKVAGPIDFAVVGLMTRISAALAAANVSLFALSTFDTDYVLVRSAQLDTALAELNRAGFATA